MSTSILKKTYLEKAVPNLKESLGFKSNMAVPKITKVTLNMGLGPDAVNDRKKHRLDYENIYCLQRPNNLYLQITFYT